MSMLALGRVLDIQKAKYFHDLVSIWHTMCADTVLSDTCVLKLTVAYFWYALPIMYTLDTHVNTKIN